MCFLCEYLGGRSWSAKRAGENGARKSEPAQKPLNFEFSLFVHECSILISLKLHAMTDFIIVTNNKQGGVIVCCLQTVSSLFLLLVLARRKIGGVLRVYRVFNHFNLLMRLSWLRLASDCSFVSFFRILAMFISVIAACF